MPVYAYRCESCGVQFERHRSFTASALKRCPECNKNSLHKVIGLVGVVFKGSGFYATDNRLTTGLDSPKSKCESDTEEKSESKTSTEGAKKESKSSDKKE